jgi:hypothetical protein
MIPAIAAILLMVAPMGYLTGREFARRFTPDYIDGLPIVSAVIMPMAAVLALVLIVTEETATEEEDNE